MLKQDVSLSDLEFITDLSPSESDSVTGGEYAVYTVKRGDTLWGIADGRQGCINAIVKRNNISNRNLIFPGQKLEIPYSGCL